MHSVVSSPKVFDFTKRRMHVHDVSEARLRDFFLGKRTKDTILRWIMVEWCVDRHMDRFLLYVVVCRLD
jgi:hypothetical protein